MSLGYTKYYLLTGSFKLYNIRMTTWSFADSLPRYFHYYEIATSWKDVCLIVINCKNKESRILFFKRLDSKCRFLTKNPAMVSESPNGEGSLDFPKEGKEIEKKKRKETARGLLILELS